MRTSIVLPMNSNQIRDNRSSVPNSVNHAEDGSIIAKDVLACNSAATLKAFVVVCRISNPQ